MIAGRRSRARLLLLEGLYAALLIAFALSVRTESVVPAFSGTEKGPTQELRTPSLLDLVLTRTDAAKRLLKAGFPMLRYLDGSRSDAPTPGLLAEAIGYFMGFTPRYSRDLAFAGMAGFLVGSEALPEGLTAVGLEKDWGLTPVLYSLPPGDEAKLAAVTLSSGPMVAVYHTHATESFLPEVGRKDAAEAFSDNPARTVVQVGEMLARELEQRYRIPCLHSTTMHDADTRIGAYYRSEATVKAILQRYPDCRVLVDLHRDSQPRNVTSVTVRGKPYARLMIVIGTDNPNWVRNYEFASKVIAKLEEGYPGVSRGIFYESAVYNQKYSHAAVLVECGGVGNTLAECRNSAEALAWALASAILPAAPPRP